MSTLAMLVKRFPRLSETFVLNEILQLRERGIPVRVHAVLDPGEDQRHPEAAALRPEVCYLRTGDGPGSWLGLTARAVSAAASRPRGAARAIRFGLARRSSATWRHVAEGIVMAEHVDREGAGHLHAHFAHGPAAIAYLTHLVTGVPFSFTAHAKDLYTTPPAYVAQRGRAAEFVVTCTEANRAYLRKLLGPDGDKVIVCRHGVDVERFSAVVRRPVPGRILSIGRLVQKKGFDVLVRALAVLAERGVAFECRVVGDGPLAEELQALARTVGIDRHVAFLGARPQVELLAEYGAAEVFALAPVITSDGDRDGIPNVLAEAMASGLPVVSAAVSGIPELIHHGDTGVLVPPSDPPALADALQELLIDPAEGSRLGEAARRWVAMNWDLRDAVAPLAELFAERLGMRSMAGA